MSEYVESRRWAMTMICLSSLPTRRSRTSRTSRIVRRKRPERKSGFMSEARMTSNAMSARSTKITIKSISSQDFIYSAANLAGRISMIPRICEPKRKCVGTSATQKAKDTAATAKVTLVNPAIGKISRGMVAISHTIKRVASSAHTNWIALSGPTTNRWSQESSSTTSLNLVGPGFSAVRWRPRRRASAQENCQEPRRLNWAC
mmetsp:Transcript_18590/g.43730  ORF Transcript_18590/g.43730 Transcript_18590/m.43730 type:complete len:203 (+) Transcript_18590:1131-1739(+)